MFEIFFVRKIKNIAVTCIMNYFITGRDSSLGQSLEAGTLTTTPPHLPSRLYHMSHVALLCTGGEQFFVFVLKTMN